MQENNDVAYEDTLQDGDDEILDEIWDAAADQPDNIDASLFLQPLPTVQSITSAARAQYA